MTLRLLAGHSVLAGDRPLASGGVMPLEGSAGSVLTPWALIAGLGTDQQIGGSAFCTRGLSEDSRASTKPRHYAAEQAADTFRPGIIVI